MPRRPRPDVPGSMHHVVLRGNNRQDVFTTSRTRRAFLDHVGEAVDRLGCRIHAFCLMTNHIHLALQQGSVSLSRIVQFLAQRHAVETNRARGGVGHLFQGRFSSSAVETDPYVLELVRYIHMNPVRAGVAAAPEQWPWSSHPAYMGLARHRFLTTEFVLGMLGAPTEAPARFQAFVLARAEGEGAGNGPGAPCIAPPGRPELPGTPFPSDATDFVRNAVRSREDVAGAGVPLDRVVAVVLAETGLSEAELASEIRCRGPAHARAEIAWLSLRAPSASLSEVARRFHRDLSTLSEAVSKLEASLPGDPSRRARLERLLRGVRLG